MKNSLSSKESGRKREEVVLRGTGASELPPDVFEQALFENGVLEDNIVSNICMTMPHNNKKKVCLWRLLVITCVQRCGPRSLDISTPARTSLPGAI